jgi:hypothetical protein
VPKLGAVSCGRHDGEKTVKIAILGWGSLLWEGGADFDSRHGPWNYDGPTLKLEFSRISERRLGALTLVLDEDHGTPTTVAWCLSNRTSVDDAVCDLRSREDTTVNNIGRIFVPSMESSTPGAASDPILPWAQRKRLDSVLWAALKSNFEEKTNQPFTVAAAVSYLKRLKPEAKAKAAEYVWRAPPFVATPVRSAFETEPWFPKVGS